MEQGIALYDPQQHAAHAFLYGQDPGVVCLSYGLGFVVPWLSGPGLEEESRSAHLGSGAVPP